MKPNRSRLLLTLLLAAVMILTLAACGGEEEPTPTPEPPVAADTPVPPPPTDTPEPPPPTDTPIPPTEIPIPEPEVGADFVPFESAEGGFTLRYPDGWFAEDLFGIAMFASEEELLDAPDPGEEGGVAMVIAGDASEFEGDDPVAMLEATADEMDISEDAKITEGPTAVTINGQDAATAVIQGSSENGDPLSAFLTIITNGDRVVIVVAATPAETEQEFRPQFEAMAESIEVGEPTEPVVEMPDLPPSEGILLYGDSGTGIVPVDGASAWEFIGLAGESVDIIIRPQDDDLDAVFDILDESGASILDFEIDDSFGVEELRGLTLPSSGTFSIFIRGFAGSGGGYDITLAESGTLTGAEGAISYGEILAGTTVSEEGATWAFFGEEGDFVDITVLPFDEFDLVLDVLDTNGNSLLDEGPVDDSFDTEFIRILRLPSSGQYTIVVSGYEGTIGDYEVALDLSNGGQPGSIVFAADTLDADNTEGHAFPFTGLAGEVVTFQVDPVFELDVILSIINDDTDEMIGEEVDSYTGFEELIFTVPEDGNYYFLVTRFEDTAGDYDATLLGSDFVLFELATFDGVIGRFGDDALISYIFRGSAGDKVVFTAETNDELDLVLEIEDLDGNVLTQIDEATSGGTETMTYEFTEDMVIYVDITEFFGEPGQFILFVDPAE